MEILKAISNLSFEAFKKLCLEILLILHPDSDLEIILTDREPFNIDGFEKVSGRNTRIIASCEAFKEPSNDLIRLKIRMILENCFPKADKIIIIFKSEIPKGFSVILEAIQKSVRDVSIEIFGCDELTSVIRANPYLIEKYLGTSNGNDLKLLQPTVQNNEEIVDFGVVKKKAVSWYWKQPKWMKISLAPFIIVVFIGLCYLGLFGEKCEEASTKLFDIIRKYNITTPPIITPTPTPTPTPKPISPPKTKSQKPTYTTTQLIIIPTQTPPKPTYTLTPTSVALRESLEKKTFPSPNVPGHQEDSLSQLIEDKNLDYQKGVQWSKVPAEPFANYTIICKNKSKKNLVCISKAIINLKSRKSGAIVKGEWNIDEKKFTLKPDELKEIKGTIEWFGDSEVMPSFDAKVFVTHLE